MALCTLAGSGVASQGMLAPASLCSAPPPCITLCITLLHLRALLHRTLCFSITLLSLAACTPRATVMDRIRPGVVRGLVNQQTSYLQTVDHLQTSSISSVSTLVFSNLVSEGGDGRGLGVAMPHLRGNDESDGAVAAADAGHHGSGRLGAEADGVASQLDGGRSQRGDPRPGLT